MKIQSFHIQGFKSLANVKVENLSDINVFYGLNNVGKSNIFEALELWHWSLSNMSNKGASIDQIEQKFGPSILPIDGSRDETEIEVTFETSSVQDTEVDRTVIVKVTKNSWYTNTSVSSEYPMLHTIDATRRFQSERNQKRDDNTEPIRDATLKRGLFYAYLSRDMQEKKRLEAVKNILAQPPFELGEIDVALDPATDEIDIGFIRPDGRLPLENMGSGVQQLLMILGQIILNDYPIMIIEEPEMNLSPQYQQYLLIALRELMQDSAFQLSQLFISTHSPYFEFAETFFDVTMDEQGHTHVTPLPIEERKRYFPDSPLEQMRGTRLNSFNQVELYEGVIEDLGLSRGDVVIFVKNDAGRWELRTEAEIDQQIEQALNGS